MAKPKRVDRPVEKKVSIPESLATRVDLLLFNELEQKVPHGAWARYVSGLIEEDLRRRAKLAKVQLPKPYVG